MRGRQIIPLFVVLTLVVAARPALSCAVEADLHDGTTLIGSIRLPLAVGANVAVSLAAKTDCYVGIAIEQPSRVALELRPISDRPPEETFSIALVTRLFNDSTHSFQPVAETSQGPIQIKTYELHPGYYIWHIRRSSPAPVKKLSVKASSQGTHRVFVRQLEPLPLERMPTKAGTASKLPFEKYSGSTFKKVEIAFPSQLELAISLPSIWQKLGDHIQLTFTGADGWPIEPEDIHFDEKTLELTAHITLPVENYSFSAVVRQSHWPRSPLSDELLSQPLTLRVVSSQPHSLSPNVAQFATWLEDAGLAKYFDILYVYDRTSEKKSVAVPIRLSEDYESLLREVARVRNADKKVNQKDLPTTVLHLRFRGSRDLLDEIESAFVKENGVSLWYRIFRKLSLLTGMRSQDLVVLAPVYCTGGLVFESSPGEVYRHGPDCMMGTAAVPLDEKVAARLARSVSESIGGVTDLPTEVAAFLPAFLSSGAEVEYLARTPDYVEVLIRKIQGAVVRGGRDWEKIQLAFLITKTEGAGSMLRLFVDGQLASGLTYPPDSQFTKSMEPAFSDSVTSYSKRIADAFAQHLSRRSPR